MERPGNAPYRVLVVNGVAVFPWRFGKRSTDEPTAALFGSSAARFALANMKPRPVQGMLDLELPDAGLSDEEVAFVKMLRAAVDLPAVTSGRLVVVAISSSRRGLHSAEWGEVTLSDDGYISWEGFHESLTAVAPTRPVSTTPSGDFTSGAVPQKLKPADSDAVNFENDDR
ncbi:hypothetical protein ACFVAV_34015 [Nocardia sp. NPDC057663]|uniref:hypothetical protein n=1 Tax=Nocardia sp. NPDC057663 TaxID=3346201 RepID=UPI003670A3E9